jgi:hypothetical protein
MASIYTEGGELDLVAATEQLANVRDLGNAQAAERFIDEVTTAALLDIAGSLRVLARKAEIDTVDAHPEYFDDSDEYEIYDRSAALHAAPAGTRVRLVTGNDPDEGPRTGILSGASGVDQDLDWYGVHWDDEDIDSEKRVYATHLEVFTSHETPNADEAPSPGDDTPDRGDLVDDIDADFDGPSSPPDALASLRSKKGKGKKS